MTAPLKLGRLHDRNPISAAQAIAWAAEADALLRSAEAWDVAPPRLIAANAATLRRAIDVLKAALARADGVPAAPIPHDYLVALDVDPS